MAGIETKSAVLFPGQGAQSVGMGKDVFDCSPRAREIYRQAGDVLGIDVASLCFDGPAERLERTDVQQVAIFVTSMAIWEAFLEAGAKRARFTHTGGLSLGEYTALCVAGAIEFCDAVEVVRRRGELMQAAAVAAPSGMVSLVGADEVLARRICDQASEGEVLTPANYNCPGQIVLAGAKGACRRALAAAEAAGCRALPLPVAGAFHSPLMESAAAGLKDVLADVPLREPSMHVVSNVNADYHGNARSIRQTLCKQATYPVLWQRCIERLISDGVSEFVEIGPGRVLTGLMRKIDRRRSVTNVSTAGSLTLVPTSAGAG